MKEINPLSFENQKINKINEKTIEKKTKNY